MNEPMRVLILDTVMDRGGAEAMTMNYYRNMDRSKIQYDFLVHRDYKAAYEDEITSLGGKIYRICPPYPQNIFRYKGQFRNLLKEHPEYQIIHSNMMENALFAYQEAHRQHIPVIICHAHIAEVKAQLTAKGVVKAVFRKLMKPDITHKFACGKKAAEWVFGKGNTDDVIYMKNAVDAKQFCYDPAVERSVRDEFDLGDRFIIGHVGRFFAQKNHPFIVKIFAEVAKRDENAVLMLVGGGELDDAVMNQTKQAFADLGLSDRVIFTGVRTDVNRIMQAFDVFILPSLQEGFPVVMVEAQAAGLHCVMSDCVTAECDLTGRVESLSLEEGAAFWAEHILAYRNNCEKADMYETIVKAGYDIRENAKWLQEFYLHAVK